MQCLPIPKISYHREDSPANARLLDERLRAKFEVSLVFMDVHDVDPGEGRRRPLDAGSTATHVIALIGPRRLSKRPMPRAKRLDNRVFLTLGQLSTCPSCAGGSATRGRTPDGLRDDQRGRHLDRLSAERVTVRRSDPREPDPAQHRDADPHGGGQELLQSAGRGRRLRSGHRRRRSRSTARRRATSRMVSRMHPPW